MARFIDRLLTVLFLVIVIGGTISIEDYLPEIVISIVTVVSVIVAVAYILLRDALPFLDGQSIGKKALGIRVVNVADGTAIIGKYGTALIREFVQWIPILNMIDIAVVIFVGTKQRLGDQWANTQVIGNRRKTTNNYL